MVASFRLLFRSAGLQPGTLPRGRHRNRKRFESSAAAFSAAFIRPKAVVARRLFTAR